MLSRLPSAHLLYCPRLALRSEKRAERAVGDLAKRVRYRFRGSHRSPLCPRLCPRLLVEPDARGRDLALIAVAVLRMGIRDYLSGLKERLCGAPQPRGTHQPVLGCGDSR